MAQKKKKKSKKKQVSTGRSKRGMKTQQIVMGIIGILIILSMVIPSLISR